ncbi:MAG: hypothetical protein EXR98_02770 [Gemmataceae bacterium]|nr:hypothetical protein [Gemmataceae bacterium]
MRRILGVTMFALAAVVPFGVGAPTIGSWSDYVEVGSQSWTTTKSFRGGERACVLVIGDHKEEVQLEVTIHDVAKGTTVAADKTANKLVGDYVGVIWYPPRDGDYRIDVRSSGGSLNKCYIAIK